MNFTLFKDFLTKDADFVRLIKKTGMIMLMLTIFCTASSFQRAQQRADLKIAHEKAKQMQDVIDENIVLNDEYNKATADGSSLLSKDDLNLFQEFMLQKMQKMQLNILELKYINDEKDKEKKDSKDDEDNEYKYDIVFEGSYGNALGFIDSLLEAEFQNKPRMLNIEKIKFEATKNNSVNVDVVYKIFTE